ncbi:MAG: hypothetical protein V7K97_11935 [Nostoc sp.]|uniref:hypothetical protein n=1 Tax=Nostoc sp. TaxID=1180 RepID=UPI002FFD267A
MTLSKQLALTDSETLEEVLICLTENISIETQGACDQKTTESGIHQAKVPISKATA